LVLFLSRESGDRQTVFRTAQPDNHQLGRLRSAIALQALTKVIANNTAPIGESTRSFCRRHGASNVYRLL
jgi:hypothetical protein